MARSQQGDSPTGSRHEASPPHSDDGEAAPWMKPQVTLHSSAHDDDEASPHGADIYPPDLEKMPHVLRWEYIGAQRTCGYHPSPPAHPLVAHPFSRIATSQRLSPLDEEDGVRRLRGGLTLTEQVSMFSPKGSERPQFRPSETEAGSSLRFLQKSASASAIPERLLPADHLDKVTQGLEHLAGPNGPTAVTKKKLGASRFAQQEKARRPPPPTSLGGADQPVTHSVSMSESPTNSPSRRRRGAGRLVALTEFRCWCRQIWHCRSSMGRYDQYRSSK